MTSRRNVLDHWAWRGPLAALGVAVLLLTGMATAGSSATTDPETLTLAINDDTGTFTYSGATESQPFAPVKGCEVTIDGALVSMSTDANNKSVGVNSNGLGVKSGGSNGTPCGRVEANAKNPANGETLTLTLTDAVPAAVSAELDLELKGDVDLEIDLSLAGVATETFTILAGGLTSTGGAQGTMEEPFAVTMQSPQTTGNCRNDSDAGPDSGIRDNCRVTIIPAGPFDGLTLKPMVGEVSLEGGGDFTGEVLPDGFNPATIFTLSSVVYDGELGCTEENNTAGPESDGAIQATITRYENTDGSECDLKPYTLVVSASDPNQGGTETVIFEVADPGTQPAIYEALLVFDQPLSTPLDAVLQYDPDGSDGYDDFTSTLACVEDPFDLADDPAGSLNNEAIPAGEDACIVSVNQEWDGTTTWHAIFAGDWAFR